MPKFLIEVTHENTKESCDQAVQVFKKTGSHFLTNADWGCSDEVHKSWFTVDVDNKQEALFIVPPLFRHHTKVITINKFAFNEADEVVPQHQ